MPALVLVLSCAGALAGCGVKGPLEPPGGSAPAPAQRGPVTGQASSTIGASSVDSTTPNWGQAQSEASSVASSSTTTTLGLPQATSAVNITQSVGSGTATGGQPSGGRASNSGAPVKIDDIKRPNRPFFLDGLL
ncbi:LPS translocon maturation chaperone LptM [Xanthobacteraceae bacterium A53D]